MEIPLLKDIIIVFGLAIGVLLVSHRLRLPTIVGFVITGILAGPYGLGLIGAAHGLLANNVYNFFLAVTVVTMGATPFIMGLAPRMVDFLLHLPLPRKVKTGLSPLSSADNAQYHDLRDHLIVIGFGVNGKNVARAAPAATRRIAGNARELNPKVRIIARTRFVQEMIPLYELGADEVIPEEVETSVEIFARVLMKYLITRDEIKKFIAEVRADGYEMLQSLSKKTISLSDLELDLPHIEINLGLQYTDGFSLKPAEYGPSRLSDCSPRPAQFGRP